MRFKLLSLVLISSLILTACIKKEETKTNFAKEYENLNEKLDSDGNEFQSLDLKNSEIIEYADYALINKALDDAAVIYFGYPESHESRAVVPLLLEAAKESGLEKIYYMNIKIEQSDYSLDENNELQVNKKASADYLNLLNRLSNHLDDYILYKKDGTKFLSGEKRIFAPMIVFVKDAEIIYLYKSSSKGQINFSEEEAKNLMQRLIDNMNVVLALVCTEDLEC